MTRFAQLIIGPAGSGKSSYVSAMVRHGEAVNRTIHAFNLDPAAEHFDYEPIGDIRELISVDDIQGRRRASVRTQRRSNLCNGVFDVELGLV